MAFSSAYIDEPTRQFRDAMRLLFILTECGDPAGTPPPVPNALRVISSQKSLQKMDFWVRNPDHLAHALLDVYGETNESKWLRYAQAILGTEEPEVRRDAMAKYLYGAFEPIDTGLAPLISYGLAQTLRHPQTRRLRFFLLDRGEQVASKMQAELPEAHWYSGRARLVAELCRGRSGEDLARMQYQQPEYANAPNGETIASIAAQVRARLANLEGHS
ncbi:Hypothetical protein GbCGDNIH9_8516 [Granulibacter bethesdensis]|uniref:Uncharacterized protein n=1 Tax=Granulibacter bethesdensis TaxID=364410 RepID=A0AAC9K730_9PROT|nr:hypothetical protein [Granulibacter bethesdensis]APH54451.1 Hypothetical protein GbCGDNIH9_8516 [Granulibacter bethesdensis]APH62037.1 Hypothetical protein GbCGDNIH8_8516 [Granulibacter bethesdensis]